MVLELELHSLESTERLARKLAPLLQSEDVIALRGDLGAGKTTFARALLKFLGIDEDVPSPTFSLVQIYEGRGFPIYHFDFYRLKTPQEVEELGFDEACSQGLVIVEWPEKAERYLPHDRLELFFHQDESGNRTVTIKGHGKWQKRAEKIKE